MCFQFPELDPSAPAVDSQVSDLGVDDSGKRNWADSTSERKKLGKLL
jgi:hypothetical protein